MSERPVVQVQGLVKTYEGGLVRALDGADLAVAAGEFVAVQGPSGCGSRHCSCSMDIPGA